MRFRTPRLRATAVPGGSLLATATTVMALLLEAGERAAGVSG
jgi:hypothetical protein